MSSVLAAGRRYLPRGWSDLGRQLAIWFGFHAFGYWTLDAPKFVGLENYRDIILDPRFWQAAQFTLLIIAIVTPTEMIIGTIVALLLDQIPKGRRGIFIALCLTTP